jgi:uncharacterized protein YcbK (DUF882 family)
MPAGLKQANYGSCATGAATSPTKMDPQSLLDLVWEVYRYTGAAQGTTSTSSAAYRSPATNSMLRGRCRTASPRRASTCWATRSTSSFPASR